MLLRGQGAKGEGNGWAVEFGIAMTGASSNGSFYSIYVLHFHFWGMAVGHMTDCSVFLLFDVATPFFLRAAQHLMCPVYSVDDQCVPLHDQSMVGWFGA